MVELRQRRRRNKKILEPWRRNWKLYLSLRPAPLLLVFIWLLRIGYGRFSLVRSLILITRTLLVVLVSL